MSIGAEIHDGRRPLARSDAPQAGAPVLISDATVGVAANVDSDEINLRRVHQALRTSGFRIGAATAEVEELLEECAEQGLDVMIAAGKHECLSSTTRLRELRQRAPRVPIVVVVPTTDTRSLRRMLAAGVEGCVREADIERVLGLTVAAVLVGQLCVPASMRHLVTKPAFSQREKEVLELVARGLTNGQIADRLYLAESTVKSHLSSGFRKLGVNSRQEAAAILLDPEQGLTPQLMSVSASEIDGEGQILS